MSSVSRGALIVCCFCMSALIAGCATMDGLTTTSSTKHYRQPKAKKVVRRHKPARLQNASIDKAVAAPISTSHIETGSIDDDKKAATDASANTQAIDSGDAIAPPKQESRLPQEEAAPAQPVTSRDDPRWRWCEQRHIDHQAGRAPGGATDLAKKLEDDRICAAVYERG